MMTDNPQVPSPASALRAEVEAPKYRVGDRPPHPPQCEADSDYWLVADLHNAMVAIEHGMDKVAAGQSRDAAFNALLDRLALLRRCADRLREMEGEGQFTENEAEELMWLAIRPWIEADRMSPRFLADRREFHRGLHREKIAAFRTPAAAGGAG